MNNKRLQYIQEVLRVYPDAKCKRMRQVRLFRTGMFYQIIRDESDYIGLTVWHISSLDAWEEAANIVSGKNNKSKGIESKTGKRIPISDAKAIGKKNGYSQVIITAFDKRTGTTSVCTWGENLEDCDQAAQGGNFVKKALGWPEGMCNTKPAKSKLKN